ncbi:hypothetical protein Rsub_01115 [Raphidocelis subcapitata]|uniref:EF-hand domain-containing protein n=1 Tax=Raphidocelis subcapitata TaxID=307507 RepID=A0A2V0NS83_9CHLO|nr:hypothetical protein Rsub_01115 [Raphidocelis subcapitata]|eukprot:GBF88403.1 hypothetical protein Rsub_01115 [Raphidocelis subcapitata]
MRALSAPRAGWEGTALCCRGVRSAAAADPARRAWPRRAERPLPPRATAGPEEGSTALEAGSPPPSPELSAAAAPRYLRAPLAAGSDVRHDGPVVLASTLPAGAAVRAGGDVVVMGRVEGAAYAAGAGSMVVAALGFGRGAAVSVGGVAAAEVPVVAAPQMALLEGGRVVFKPLPGAALSAAPEAAGQGLVSQLLPAASLALGAALIAVPSTALGSLIGGGAEGVVAALLESALFGYILLQGAGLLAEGSELLLEVVDPGIIGGVLLPVLGALPDALIILNAGLKGSREMAQEQLAVGMGTLAGSTVLLLSLGWGLSVLLGRCDLSESGRALDKTLTRGFDLNRTGVTTEDDVRRGALILAASALLYGIVQVPAFLGFSESPQAALTGAVVCTAAAVAYVVYSVASPELQRRKIDAARKRRLRLYVVKALAERTVAAPRLGALVDPSGRVNTATLRNVFEEFDTDRSGSIDAAEVQALLLGLQLGGENGPPGLSADRETTAAFFAEMDLDNDSQITFQEFERCMQKWVAAKLAAAAGAGGDGAFTSLLDPRQGGATAALLADLPPADIAQLRATAAAVEAEPPDEAAEDMAGEEGQGGVALPRSQLLLRAGAMLAGGVALCAVFSDPLVESLTNLSRASGIAPFFVGFVLTPLASNSSEFVSSLRFAARKRITNMSLTLAQLYGAATLNNTLCLGLFLYVVWARQLPWVYSSEVTVIVTCSLLLGALGYSRTTFKAKWALPTMALYPLSLLAVHLLDTKLGWQ